MTEDTVTYETAVLAQVKGSDVGRDWYVIENFTYKDGLRHPKGDIIPGSESWRYVDDYSELLIKAPTQALLQKWLRKERSLAVLVNYNNFMPYYEIIPLDPDMGLKRSVSGYDYNTYEEALEQGLQTALKLIDDE